MRKIKLRREILILTLSISVTALLALQGNAAQEVENLIINPDFEQGIVGWELELHADQGAAAQLKVDDDNALVGDQCMLIEIQKLDGSGTWWHVGLNQINLAVEAGETYTLAVWARTENKKARTIRLAGGENHGPWANWGDKDFTITDEWTEYHTTWNQINNDNNARIRIATGQSEEDVWVDHVRFYVGEYQEEDLEGLEVEEAAHPKGKLATIWANLKAK